MRRHTIIPALAALLLALIGLGCPSGDVDWDNPFDPDSPDHENVGLAYNLTVTTDHNQVILDWDPPLPGASFDGFLIYQAQAPDDGGECVQIPAEERNPIEGAGTSADDTKQILKTSNITPLYIDAERTTLTDGLSFCYWVGMLTGAEAVAMSEGVAVALQRDEDEDGIRDSYPDNCIDKHNTDQLDVDADGIGDACDDCPVAWDPSNSCPDTDGDGVLDDGDNSGATDDRPCAEGESSKCDDNCPTLENLDQADGDADGVGDACDNCPAVANADQADDDTEHEGGNACQDTDRDEVLEDGDGSGVSGDGYCTGGLNIGCDDNCPLDGNVSQGDMDGDAIGDACDFCPEFATARVDNTDQDGDGVGDACDNCPDTPNVGQADEDGDGVGDACRDSDGDAIRDDGDRSGDATDNRCTGGATADCDDNCPALSNPAQADEDGDGVGDLCDNCLGLANPQQVDDDGNGVGNACQDTDDDSVLDDGDGSGVTGDQTCVGGNTTNCDDNCPADKNDDQADGDNDGAGDLCDNCPGLSNPAQRDPDGDGQGSACDDDRDGDGIPNDTDHCPDVPDPDNNCRDTDGDGVFDDGGGSGTAGDEGCVGGAVDVCDDNCIDVANADQADGDSDGVGDLCDNCPENTNADQDPLACADTDSDGILDDGSGNLVAGDAPCSGGVTAGCDDNCRTVGNPAQDDADGDGVGDLCDNCSNAINPGQADDDPIHVGGNACQDYDRDSILEDGDGDGVTGNNRCTGGNTVTCDDNCAGVPNSDQADGDSDGAGDLCDNCPEDANPDQKDIDGDDQGDLCDDDRDGDGIPNDTDHCPDVPDPEDACRDTDGDGIFDDGGGSGTNGDQTCKGGATEGCDDNCIGDANSDQADGDGDGVGDLCDNCPTRANPTQDAVACRDTDSDGILDDGDGSVQAGDGPCTGGATEACDDNCVDIGNPDQADGDADGVGDLCDSCPDHANADQNPMACEDTDSDGILDDGSGNGVSGDARCKDGATEGCDDNCPNAGNPNQADDDGDGIGNICDNCPDVVNASQIDDDTEHAGGNACQDQDSDTILDDGDRNGVTGDNPCVGGNTVNCDDNCPETPDNNQSDEDLDGVGTLCDNCPDTSNADQRDTDGDGDGDVCDDDRDGDGIPNADDLCPDANDPTNLCLDADQDGVFDDGDGSGTVGDATCAGGEIARCDDNCVGVVNPLQEDVDGDGVGDACDNCPADANADQTDDDIKHAGGNACQDFDNDGILEDGDGSGVTDDGGCVGGEVADCDDNCPVIPNAGQEDRDEDGAGDLCDNCPEIQNPDQRDIDRDDLGDLCDPDRDGDGVPNDEDNCPDIPDRENICNDSDGDTIFDDGNGSWIAGDAPCRGGETVNCDDNCPHDVNTNQQDVDGDGVGDVCDNCPDHANSTQNPLACQDTDSDTVLDDGDGSGVVGDAPCAGGETDGCDDNCLDLGNPTQADADGDGVGDFCDNCPDVANPGQQALACQDNDSDGVLDDGGGSGLVGDEPCSGGETASCDDNCPGVGNPDQADPDGDGVGSLCDNCPNTANADQDDDDTDHPGGNACQDVDDDGVLDDGDGNGATGDNRCIGGNTASCDDNCPGDANANQADSDLDALGDVCDNCPGDANPDQKDLDSDGVGNVCDPDRDGDGIPNTEDSCPNVPDPLDACKDTDGDTVFDDGAGSGTAGDEPCTGGQTQLCDDNCVDVHNPDQADRDGDGIGDLCDNCPDHYNPDGHRLACLDTDHDGILDDGDGSRVIGDGHCTGGNTENCDDNCPGNFNPEQADPDGDGIGGACDNCPEIANPDQNPLACQDTDLDGIRDDGNGSGVAGDVPCAGGNTENCDDNCPNNFNPLQEDEDLDAVGDSCDNCGALANKDQANQDGDGLGDLCDPDIDGDDIPQDGDGSGTDWDNPCKTGEQWDCDDNCPMLRNPDQQDTDDDGHGDVCDGCPDAANSAAGDGCPDSDGDGIGDDGGNSGTAGDYPCTAGDTTRCDDNCVDVQNPDQADRDGDGVGDLCDNCPQKFNDDQTDLDGDGQGDPCDEDTDDDGILDDGDFSGNPEDNPCPAGETQLCDDPCPRDPTNDLDGDGICADDRDPCPHGQPTADCGDNCMYVFNPQQLDHDQDGIGDECDNCPFVANPLQEETEDGDSHGDACDNCPLDANEDQNDGDGDLIGDVCDGDRDADGIPEDGDQSGSTTDKRCVLGNKTDCDDNCPNQANATQADSDGDGIGNACDSCPDTPNPNPLSDGCLDTDGDGIGDDATPGDGLDRGAPCTGGVNTGCDDNCIAVINPSQEDVDWDSVGDVCDNCVGLANTDQADLDGNGVGDPCDQDVDGDGIPQDGDGSGNPTDNPCGPGETENCDDSCPRDPTNDADGDGVCGDETDPCTGGATVNCGDNCPDDANPLQEDTDGDGVGDVCDDCVDDWDPSNACNDFDSDGVLDDGDLTGSVIDNFCEDGETERCDDNCITVANPGQEDVDDDLVGDACDNCMFVPNPDQADADGDNVGDLCEDDDGDGIMVDGDNSGDPNDNPCRGAPPIGCDDNCPLVYNADQEDFDGDGIGDACDDSLDLDGNVQSTYELEGLQDSYVYVRVFNNATLRVPAPDATTVHSLEIESPEVIVESGSQITVASRGYYRGHGVGNVLYSFGNRDCGGSHAGQGGYRDEQGPAPMYGDFRYPTLPGSGGCESGGTGGNGGGYLRIKTDRLQIDGILNASGGGCSGDAGGGAGGSILLEFSGSGVIEGAGRIRAVGANCAQGSGGGGRIALLDYAGPLPDALSLEAWGGYRDNNYSYSNGGAGTIFSRRATDAEGELWMINYDHLTPRSIYVYNDTTYLPSIGRGESDSLTYDAGSGVTTLTDAEASWPVGHLGQGELIGARVNPDITQAQTFVVVNNTATELMLEGDATAVAAAGDTYRGLLELENLYLNQARATSSGDDVRITVGDRERATGAPVGTVNILGRLVAASLDVNGVDETIFGVTTSSFEYTGPDDLTDLTVKSGGWITRHSCNIDRPQRMRMDLGVRNLTIESGGGISMNSRGYAGGNNCGNTRWYGYTVGNTWEMGANGGSSDYVAGTHGGRGGYYEGWPRRNYEYDDLRHPDHPGSGGGAWNNGGGNDFGGAGGGVVNIAVSGDAVIDGAIHASGQTGGDRGGGGAGGSVYLDVAGAITGSGKIYAVGGAGGRNEAGSGGGGRIAVVGFTSLDPAIQMSARGGYRRLTDYLQTKGGAGTIYTRSATQENGRVRIDQTNIDNGQLANPNTWDTYLPRFAPHAIGTITYDSGTDTTRITSADPAQKYFVHGAVGERFEYASVLSPPPQIPDNNSTGVTDVVTVPDIGLVERVQLYVNIVQESTDDLQIYLTSPEGTQATVFNKRWNAGSLKLIFDLDSPSSDDLRSKFRYENAQGDWQLWVRDTTSGGYPGELYDWKLIVYVHDPLAEGRLGHFVGRQLNPNVDQLADPPALFTIVDNTHDTLILDGDATGIASAGDTMRLALQLDNLEVPSGMAEWQYTQVRVIEGSSPDNFEIGSSAYLYTDRLDLNHIANVTVNGYLYSHHGWPNLDGTLTIPDAGYMSLGGCSSTDDTRGVIDLDLQMLDVKSGGRLDVNGDGYVGGFSSGNSSSSGYTVGNVPGATATATTSQGAGSHGGLGGYTGSGSRPGAYGDLAAPMTMGSGGAAYSNGGTTDRGGDGGGVIHLRAPLIQVNGTISANGSGASDRGSGGAGGSVFVEITDGGQLLGNGSITANGQNGGHWWDVASGGGGRIAITGYSGDLPDNLSIQAKGGDAGNQSARGGAGTVYLLPDGAALPTVIFDNFNVDPYDSTARLLEQGGVPYEFEDLIIQQGARVYSHENIRIHKDYDEVGMRYQIPYAGTVWSRLWVRQLEFVNGANLRMNRNGYIWTTDILGLNELVIRADGYISAPGASDTDASLGRLNLEAALFIIDAGGYVDLNCDGYYGARRGANDTNTGMTLTAIDDATPTTTGGATAVSTPYAAGGSYGGQGGYYSDSRPNAVYGDMFFPDELGSGGAGNWNQGGSNDRGGDGGGFVRLSATDLTINGTIRADGCGGSDRGGGGSGGAIRIEMQGAGPISGTGAISAIGANTGHWWESGSGGGGRIAISGYGGEFPATVGVSAKGGDAGNEYHRGAAGTIVFRPDGATEFDVRIDNQGLYSSRDGDHVGINGKTFNNLTVNTNVYNLTDVNVLGDMTISSLGRLYSTDWTLANPDRGFLDVNVGGTLTISSGTISAYARGYAGAYRHDNATNLGITLGGTTDGGATSSATSVMAGGSYGGLGGVRGASATNAQYGDLFWPTELGSGGAAWNNGGGNDHGGDGGGALHLKVGALVNDGYIQAHGGGGSDRGAGGSGGSILIEVNGGTVTGSGELRVNGGGCGHWWEAASGGGGRLAVIGFTDAFPASMHLYAWGGRCQDDTGVPGGPGTIVLHPQGQAAPDLIYDNYDYGASSASTRSNVGSRLRAIGNGAWTDVTFLDASDPDHPSSTALTDDTRTWPLPDPAINAIGLTGLWLDPTYTPVSTLLEVVDNDVDTIWISGDETGNVSITDSYIGKYEFNSITVRNYAKVATSDCVIGTIDVQDANSSFTPGTCPQ